MHNSLANYYEVQFALAQHHKYSITEIESLMPWERDIYVTMLNNWVKEEQERMRSEQARQKTGR